MTTIIKDLWEHLPHDSEVEYTLLDTVIQCRYPDGIRCQGVKQTWAVIQPFRSASITVELDRYIGGEALDWRILVRSYYKEFSTHQPIKKLAKMIHNRCSSHLKKMYDAVEISKKADEELQVKQDIDQAVLNCFWAIMEEKDLLDRSSSIKVISKGGKITLTIRDLEPRTAVEAVGRLHPDNSSLRERLAELCHEQWSGWMRYVFSEERGAMLPTPAWVINTESYKRWRRQMETPYKDLSEEEKESDRKEADRFLAVLHGE